MTYFSVEMLPAAHGDCLWIEWDEDRSTRRRMLIDGGPAHAYAALYNRVLQLPPGERSIDLLVVTHIDADHIDGIIRLLLDREALGLKVKRLWFNGRRELDEVPGALSETLGAVEGEYLGLLAGDLADEGTEVNPGFDHPWIGIDRNVDEPLPTFDLPGLRLTLLSPDTDHLLTLSDKWTETINAAGFATGGTDALRARLAADPRLHPMTDVLGDEIPNPAAIPTDFGVEAEPGSDTTVANGSSIAFLADFTPADDGGAAVRYLFTGDAHASVLEVSLERWCRDNAADYLKLNGFKVPHHGSIANVSAELLKRLRTRHHLISTSGAHFNHPHESAVELMIEHHGRGKPNLHFNYASDTTTVFANRDDAHAHYPTGTSVTHSS